MGILQTPLSNLTASTQQSALIQPTAPLSTVSASGAASSSVNTSTGSLVPSTDNRVRLRAMRGQEATVYGAQAGAASTSTDSAVSASSATSSTTGTTALNTPTASGTGSASTGNNLLSILYDTDGLLFPYTPQIAVSQAVDYKNTELVHTNGDIAYYSRTPSVTLEVSADFTVQNQREGRYALAALHFLRTVSKMYFGDTDSQIGVAGLPPPVLIFTGYGTYIFNNLPVILKSHNYSFDKTANMVSFSTDSGVMNLPSMFSVSMSLQVQQTPQAMRQTFSLDAFRSGALLRQSTSGSGWI
jgi:hypothetical protein